MIYNFNKIILKKLSHFDMTEANKANNALNHTNVLVGGIF